MSGEKSLVFDLGACTSRIGYAGEDFPHLVFDSICGQPIIQQSTTGAAAGQLWSFDKSVVTNPGFRLRRAFDFGGIRDWEAWEELLSQCYLQMKEDPSQQPLFLTEPHRNQRETRERTIHTVFETFQVPAFFMASQAAVALYACDNESGIVIHVGDSSADLIPYLHGQAKYLEHAATSFGVSGCDVTEHLAMLLGRDRNYQGFYDRKGMELLRDAKETQCYVSTNYEKDVARVQYASKKLFETSYQLLNRTFVDMGAEKFMAPEILFRPSVDSPGIHQAIVDTVKKCDLVTRFDLYNDIVLVGGGTMVRNFRERLEQEVKALVPNDPVRIHDHPQRHLLSWKGASFVAEIPSFNQSNWVTRSEYEEHGETIVHKKCTMN